LQSQQFIITTETDTTEAREALALPKIAALRRLCGVYLCGGPTLQASCPLKWVIHNPGGYTQSDSKVGF
ncbi:MAG TPA: hypothetical protein VLE95_09175, partial [Chlamydiales bacterium]|nr:hypothetical protein [Chlamydiales bacterium]